MFISIQLYCCVWLRYLHWKQQRFLEGIAPQVEQKVPTVERAKREVTNMCLIIVGGMTQSFLEVGCRYFSQLVLKSYWMYSCNVQ